MTKEKVSKKELAEMKKTVPRGGRYQYLISKGYTPAEARKAIEEFRGVERDEKGNIVSVRGVPYKKHRIQLLSDKIEMYEERIAAAKAEIKELKATK